MNDAKIIDALFHWFEDRAVPPRDAARICAEVCGVLAHEEHQIEWLNAIMRATNETTHPKPGRLN